MIQVLGPLGRCFDAVVVFVTNSSLFFRFALANGHTVEASFECLIICSKIKFLALESHDLSQTNKIPIIVVSFLKLTHLRNDCLTN